MARRQFPSTHWSAVERVGADRSHQRDGLAEFVNRYLTPLRLHIIRRFRCDDATADDLIQGFVADKLIRDRLIDHAQRHRGRFRNFLLTSIDSYVISQFRYQNAQKRQHDHSAASLPEGIAAGDAVEPSRAFDVEWGRQLISLVLNRMEAECKATGQEAIWQVFEARLLDPLFNHAEPASYDELRRKLGFDSPKQASNLLITAKRMFTRCLHETVGEYAWDEEEISAEIKDLWTALSGAAWKR